MEIGDGCCSSVLGASTSACSSQTERNMEPLNSTSLGAMGSLLRKLNEVLRNEEGAQGLIGDLDTISMKMEKLSEVHSPPQTVKYWMNDARELSHDMEACVDQFVHTIHQPEDLSAKVAWNKEILGFKARVQEVNERCDTNSLVNKYFLSNPPKIVVRHRFRTLYEEPDPVGMEESTNKLQEWLTLKDHGEEDLKLNVVSILGDEGVGKSTLVKRIWRVSEGKFECRAFVQTAKKPDTRMILRSILSQVRPKQPLKTCKVPKLIDELRRHLQNKRYIVVIDDLWDVSVWHIVKRAFPEGNHGIITTTAVENVANVCCSYDRNRIVHVKCLRGDQAKKLFIDRAFGSEKGRPPQLNDVTDEITRKCGGFPLAIIWTARLVANQSETEQEQQLDCLNKFLPNNLRTHSSSMEILNQVLKLCYNSLPRSLKTCLLYLSVYPENYLFLKEDLVKQWIAEDFICTAEGEDISDVAGSYFDGLLNLGLIQRMGIINSNKKGLLFYTVHPVVFDFITCKSMEDNFVTTIDYSQSTVALTEKVRRLSLHFGSASYATTPASAELSQVRSLSFMGLLGCMPSIAEFKLVRVMILHIYRDDDNTRFSLSEICQLLLLRYLQVRCDVTVDLPDQMQSLKQLETLEINAGVEHVPSDLIHLSKLQHVRLGEKTNLIRGQIASVEATSSFVWCSIPPVFLESFELLPPICIFAAVPSWFRELHKLRILKIVVTKLENGIAALEELPVLTHLSLYVRTPTADSLIFGKNVFPALEDFKFARGVLLLVFLEESLPNLRKLKVAFNAHKEEQYSNMLVGIEHLSKLEKVAGSIGAAPGAEESDRRAAESAFKYAIRKHPRHRSFEQVKRIDSVDSQLKMPSWFQQGESSKKRGEQVPVWKLAFESQPELPICAGTKIKDVNGDPLKVILVNVQGTGSPSELPGKLSIEVLPLDGNFPEDWTADEFKRAADGDCGFHRSLHSWHSRHWPSDYQLLTGDVRLTMRNGCATVGELQFTDNLYRSHYRKFRIGARVLPGSYVGGRIVEAITTAFTVETGPVVLADPVWRLDWIHKDGWFHRKLEDNNIDNVQEFVRMLMVKPDDMRSILGDCTADYKRKWDEITKRARTCVPGDKVYVYTTARGTVYVNSFLDLVKVEIGGIEYPMQQLNKDQMKLVLQLIVEAYEHRHELKETNAVTYDGHATDNNSLLRARFLAQARADLQQPFVGSMIDANPWII